MEKLTLVCDLCGRPAVRSVTLKVDGRNRLIDLCDSDTRMLTKNSRAPRRGRKAATVIGAPARRGPGRPKGSKNTKKAANGRRKKRRVAKTSASA